MLLSFQPRWNRPQKNSWLTMRPKYHEDDLGDVIQRAKDVGCQKLMVTGSDITESRKAYKLAQDHRMPRQDLTKLPCLLTYLLIHNTSAGFIYSTVGVHPCNTKHLDSHVPSAESYLSELKQLAITGAASGYITAFGEIGLDYDRLFLSSMEQQKKYFLLQLDLAEEVGLPLFLHSRAAASDFEAMLFPRLSKLKGGLVHSFTGTADEMRRLVDAGLYVGVNGCSLKTEENLDVVRQIPLNRLMLETDVCSPTPASWVLSAANACACRVPGARSVPPMLRRSTCEKTTVPRSLPRSAATVSRRATW